MIGWFLLLLTVTELLNLLQVNQQMTATYPISVENQMSGLVSDRRSVLRANTLAH